MTFIEIPFASPEFDVYLSLRHLTLREPLGLEFHIEDIAQEWRHKHFGLYNSEMMLVGGMTIVPEDTKVKFRQICIDPEYQNQGLGSIMMVAAENWTWLQGYQEIYMHARVEVIPFYLKLDYLPKGDVFQEVSIDHQQLVKSQK